MGFSNVGQESQNQARPSIVSLGSEGTMVDDGVVDDQKEKNITNLASQVSEALEPSLEPATAEVEAARVESRAPVHSVFSLHQKWFIVFMSAWGGFFSPLSANIYLPALNVLAEELQVSDTLINLTLTSYMIFQGLAPMFIGELADNAGRRPAYIICFIIYIAANIGLALQRSYAALFILRCLQSSGSSSTIALASGIVADVATSAERGIWMGISQAGSLLGPAIGPVIGGLLAQFLGWPSIFWFLTIMAGVYLLIFSVIFPETGRNIVGDGSIPPPKLNWSLLNYLQYKKSLKEPTTTDNDTGLTRTRTRDEAEREKRKLAASRKLSWPNPLIVLKILCEKDVALLLLYNSLVYTAFYMVASSAPSLFQTLYGFDELQIGLAFLPYGIGCCIATWTWGYLIDWNFRRIAHKKGISYDRKRAMNMKDFPLEKSRLDIIFPLVYIGAVMILIYGWIIERNAPLAPVLVLQFLIGFLVAGAFNTMSVMIIDLYPDKPSTATACNNLVRCLVGAAGTAVVIDMINAMGRGWCFTFVALVMICFSPMLWLIYFKGPEWREERRMRSEEQKQKGKQAQQSPDTAVLAEKSTEAGHAHEKRCSADARDLN